MLSYEIFLISNQIMKLQTLKVSYLSKDIHIEKISFNAGLTLLVGASGVGKTQILQSIDNLQNLAIGRNIVGFQWDASFIDGDDIYEWKGRFLNKKLKKISQLENMLRSTKDKEIEEKVKIEYEYFQKNGIEVLKRENDQITLNGKETVKLDPYQSCIYILREEESINYFSNALMKITTLDNGGIGQAFLNFDSNIGTEKSLTLEDIKNLEISILNKCFLCQNRYPEIFEEITDAYQDIFPYVEEIKIERQSFTLKNDPDATEFGQNVLIIKESGVSEWISHDEMSSGMLKTFIQLAYLYLSPIGTIFLIDEFENGFGVNCINSISEWLINPEFNHQFIITSHHPYIINNISPKRWKIISRDSNKILSYNTDTVLDCSSHDSFIKLINLPIYKRGASHNK